LWRHDGTQVDHRADRDTGDPAQARAAEHHGVGGDEHLMGNPAAGQLRVRAGQHTITHDQRAAQRAAQHRVLHDHPAGADLHRAALGAQHRAVQDAAGGADAHLATQDGGGCHVGLGVD
jgi:hypothetical protein